MEYTPAYVKNKNGGFAEFALGFDGFDYGKIKYGGVQKLPNYGPHLVACERPFVPFYYDDPFLCKLPAVDVLMPAFSVHSWDLETGRLELNFLSDDVNVKIQLLQHHMLKAVVAHQREWIGCSDLTYETVCEIFQPFIQHERFVIYLPNGRQKKQLWICEKGTWKYGTTDRSFVAGQIVRPILKLQGLCFIMMGDRLKFRIQHQTVSIFA
jgi:hypothetical protein